MATDWERDAELLEAWRGGDRSAAAQLIDRHLDAVARFFRNKFGDATEDLIQQTFLGLVEGRDRIQDGVSIRAYLLRAAHNVMCLHLRRQARGENVDLSATRIADLAPSPASVAADRHEQRLLLHALRELPLELQVALELTYWEGLNAAEIAEIVGISHSAMRSRLVRARKLLAEVITRIGEDPRLIESTLGNLEQWAGEIAAAMSTRARGRG